MTGNLDTKYDAVLTVNNHYHDDDKARAIAEFVASQYNAAITRLQKGDNDMSQYPMTFEEWFAKRFPNLQGCVQPTEDAREAWEASRDNLRTWDL
jgi:GH25 family lysozyme M1 (1,4-beta-N-acetylmuramidase)